MGRREDCDLIFRIPISDKMLGAMTPIEWLERNVSGFFDELPSEDREAIFYFTLLWSLFEATALNMKGSVGSIRRFVCQLADKNCLVVEDFELSLDYFRQRYFPNGTASPLFSDLNFRRNDNEELVQQVLKGTGDNSIDKVIALFIIIYRLRNNLFHGNKWNNDGIQGQRENFNNANAALMNALDAYKCSRSVDAMLPNQALLTQPLQS